MLARFAALLLLFSSVPAVDASEAPSPSLAPSDAVTEGELRTTDASGALVSCPLRHTDVAADVSGFVARVTVTHQFENPFDRAIEAIYLFPLAGDAAVDRMTMKVGDRVVNGRVDRRAAARATYEAARAVGRTASLLEQERPNVFTQSVANVPPTARVEIEISYVQTLGYEAGAYRFVVPMVVGTRYVPAKPGATSATYPTSAAPPAARPGHDVSLRVSVDAGVPLGDVHSALHPVVVERPGPTRATVRLANDGEIPNRDFVLTYAVAGGRIEDAVLAHRDARGGFFTLVLQPPARAAADVTPKEVVFVLDTSGSMAGAPAEAAKATIRHALENLLPDDTFNVVTFAGVTDVLFKEPVAASPANRAKALRFVEAAEGRGGTEMMDAIRAALAPSDRQNHVRVVCFLTDGYVGNDLQILGEIQKHPNARVFALGVGEATNRFLLDTMAAEGRGDVDYVTPDDDPAEAARRFVERVRQPLLTDVSVDWNGLDVSETFPARIPDVFSAKPVVVTGRYGTPGSATIRLKGMADGREVVRDIPVVFPEAAAEHDAIATIWARRKVDDLTRQDYAGVMKRAPKEGLDEQITQVGLDFGIATQFTSFVALDEGPVVGDGAPERVDVPSAMPAGMAEFGAVGTMGKLSAGAGTGYAVHGLRSEVATVTKAGTSTMSSESVDVVAGEEGVRVAGDASPATPVADTGEPSPTRAPAEVKDLPLVSRSSLELTRLSAGAPGPSTSGADGAASGVSIDGARVSPDAVPVPPASAAETVTVTVEAGAAEATADAAVVRSSPPRPAVLADGAHPDEAWRRAKRGAAVEIVFAIDTTGSMAGLLDGAKRRIWGIVNEIMRTDCRPDVRIGIVAYRDRGDAYESMILPLTSDLDLVYRTLSDLRADGGGDTPEDVRRGLADALGAAGWSPAAPDLAQLIFLVGDAPPHAYGDLPAPEATASEAARLGILVHAVQCGADSATRVEWELVATSGGGAYFAVPADQTVGTVERTPYDGPLADLGKRLGDTYLPYGSTDAQRTASARQAMLEREVARRASRSTAADRAVNKAVNAEAYSEDFLQAIENGTLRLGSVPREDLPEDLRDLSPTKLEREVARRLAKRRALRAAILDISRLRDRFVDAASVTGDEAARGFDAAVADAVKKHLAKKGACK